MGSHFTNKARRGSDPWWADPVVSSVGDASGMGCSPLSLVTGGRGLHGIGGVLRRRRRLICAMVAGASQIWWPLQ
jgi:hypothetical protein